jgi:hypothetical protein
VYPDGEFEDLFSLDAGAAIDPGVSDGLDSGAVFIRKY